MMRGPASPTAFLPCLALSPSATAPWTAARCRRSSSLPAYAPAAAGLPRSRWLPRPARRRGNSAPTTATATATATALTLAAAAEAAAAAAGAAGVDANTLLAIAVAVLGAGAGVGLLVFYERQGIATGERENTQPCAECRGETYVVCTVCGGNGKAPVPDSAEEASGQESESGARSQALAGEETPATEAAAPAAKIAAAAAARDRLPDRAPPDACMYCDGEGKLRCFNCAGSGIQPRFLDRLGPDDFMD